MAPPDPAPSDKRSKTTAPSPELQSLASATLNQGLNAATVHIHTFTINNAPATSTPQDVTQAERGVSADPRHSTNALAQSTHGISASPPTTPPPGVRAPDCIEETIEQLLRDAPSLLESIVDSKVLDLGSYPSSTAVAKCLLSPPNNELPIMTLERIVSKWHKQRSQFRFDVRDANEFHAIKDLLVIRSLPTDDRRKVVAAIQRAKDTLKRSSENGAAPCEVSKSFEEKHGYLKRLIYEIWIESQLDPLLRVDNIRILFHQNARDQRERMRILRLVRFLKEPGVADDAQHSKGLTIDEIAQHIYQEFTESSEQIANPLEFVRDEIIPAHCNDDGGLLVMYVQDVRTMKSHLELLKEHLPQVMCLVLEERVGNQYAKVSMLLDRICSKLPNAYTDVVDKTKAVPTVT